MNSQRFHEITDAYPALRIGILGDFCLDRYLEIDPARSEISIETNLVVYNVACVRSQPGAAGTILNNLVALGVGTLFPIGFHGDDGEGFELNRALASTRGVQMEHFLHTAGRRTFTYTKPLLLHPGKAPQELNRLDFKNWTPTPEDVQRRLASSLEQLAPSLDALIIMDQVDLPETGVVTQTLLKTVARVAETYPRMFIIADSRRGLQGFPRVSFKMNLAELGALSDSSAKTSIETIRQQTADVARQNGRPTFVTLAELGMVGSLPDGTTVHAPSLPVRGEIDIVGAGDSVTANLTAATAAGATLREALQLASAAASEVIHQLGTTGTASVPQIARLFGLVVPGDRQSIGGV